MQSPPARPCIVLAIEEPELRVVARAQFEAGGIHVEQACDGFEALERILCVKPQLAILDFQLPSLTGLAVLKRLKGDRRTAPLPVILLLDAKRQAEAEQARNAGALDCFMRPFTPETLVARAEGVVRGKDILWLA
jgi:DNA-binding response OmpR family regulator